MKHVTFLSILRGLPLFFVAGIESRNTAKGFTEKYRKVPLLQRFLQWSPQNVDSFQCPNSSEFTICRWSWDSLRMCHRRRRWIFQKSLCGKMFIFEWWSQKCFGNRAIWNMGPRGEFVQSFEVVFFPDLSGFFHVFSVVFWSLASLFVYLFCFCFFWLLDLKQLEPNWGQHSAEFPAANVQQCLGRVAGEMRGGAERTHETAVSWRWQTWFCHGKVGSGYQFAIVSLPQFWFWYVLVVKRPESCRFLQQKMSFTSWRSGLPSCQTWIASGPGPSFGIGITDEKKLPVAGSAPLEVLLFSELPFPGELTRGYKIITL